MGVYTYEHDITSTISPSRIFKAFLLDVDSIIAKVAPHAVQHVEILEGNGGPGTIRKVTLGEGSKFKYVKHRVDSIDYDNLTYDHSVIEGDVLLGKLEKICHESKVVASPDGGSIIKTKIHYHTIGDAEIDEEHIKLGKEKGDGMFKIVEAYLQANPDAYN